MKILELTNYSAGGCGVWARVKEESKLLSERGHEVLVFSSNAIKGEKTLAMNEEKIGKINIKRFPYIKLGGESFMLWNFKSEALKFNPDAIIAHSYRQIHTIKALKIGKKLNCPVFLVTHASFARKSSRTSLQNLIVTLYDFFIGRKTIKKFTNVFTITNWERPYLEALGLPNERIIYLPNGIRKEFFSNPKIKESNKMIYTGRISPIKNLEIPILSIKFLKNKKLTFQLLGPAEKKYLISLKKIISENNLQARVKIIDKKFDSVEQIIKLDESKIFVLPSISEGMSQSLIEALAKGKICLVSDNLGNRDLIQDGKNGYIFRLGDEKNLASLIDKVLSEDNFDIQKQARNSVEKFSWDKIIDKLEKTIINYQHTPSDPLSQTNKILPSSTYKLNNFHKLHLKHNSYGFL